MKRESEDFVWYFGPDYLDHYGKWIVYDKIENIRKYADKLERHFEKNKLGNFKYSKHPATKVPRGYGRDCHMLAVYCDDRNRDDVQKTITEVTGISARKMHWKYDSQTLEDKR